MDGANQIGSVQTGNGRKSGEVGMINKDKVFDAFRNCITEPKCKDCPWEQCEQFNQKKVAIPVTLALDVIELLKEQETEIRQLRLALESEWECRML